MGVEINVITVSGNLTKDAELKMLSTGTAILSFSIANGYGYKQNNEWVNKVSYINVQIFGKQAESLSKMLTKGTSIVLEGELRQDRWEKDGTKHDKWYIIASKVKLMGKHESKTVETTPASESGEFVDDSIPF